MSNVKQKKFVDYIEEAIAESKAKALAEGRGEDIDELKLMETIEGIIEGTRSERIKLIGAMYDNYRKKYPSVNHDEAVSFISELSGKDRAQVEYLISERIFYSYKVSR